MLSRRHQLAPLILLLAAGCSFLIDFPEEDTATGGAGAAGAGTIAGGAGSDPGGGGEGGTGGDGGSGGQGGGECLLDRDSHALTFDWAAQVGSIDLDGFLPIAVALETDGDVWLAGQLEGGVLQAGGNAVSSTGDSVADVFLLELDAEGDSKRGFVFGGNGSAFIWDIAFAPDGELVIAGSFIGDLDFGGAGPVLESQLPVDGGQFSVYDAYVAVFDPAAEETVVAKAFGDGHYQEATAVAVDGEGSILLAAISEGSVDWGAGESMPTDGMFVVKLDSDLNEVWTRPIASNVNRPADIALFADGSVAVTGLTDRNDVFGQILGGEVVYGGSDAFVARYDGLDGSWVWHRIFGDDYDQAGTAVTVGPSGDVYVAGTYLNGLIQLGNDSLFSGAEIDYATDDVFLARLGHDDGATVWVKRVSGLGYQVANDIGVDCADRVTLLGNAGDSSGSPGVDFGDGELVQGVVSDQPNGYVDLFVAAYEGSSGNLLSKRRIGDFYIETGAALQLDPQGRALIAGAFFHTVALDPLPGATLQRTKAWDLYLARFDTVAR